LKNMAEKNIKLKDGDNYLYPQTKIENIIDYPTRDLYGTVTLTTTWAGSAAPYTQVVSTPAAMAITANDHPMLDVVISSAANKDAELAEWAKVFKAETGSGTITFYASEATSAAITVQIKN